MNDKKFAREPWVEKLRVEAISVEDFLNRYYKRDRYTGRGKEYASTLLSSYQRQLERDGYVCISHHDNVTGEFITWYPMGVTS